MDEHSKEILKHFDSTFNTNMLKEIDFNNFPMLKQLFTYFEEELYKPSPKYEQLRVKQIEVSDQLEEEFTEKQKELFGKYWEITNRMSAEEEQQLFVFGYIMAKALDKETDITKVKKKN